MTRALLLFARSPETEARSKGLPLRSGAALFHRIAQLWSEAAKSSGATLFISTDATGWTAIAPGAVVLQQHEAAFGNRLADSVERVFTSGVTALMVAGIDTPPPISATLEKAFLHLEQSSGAAVIGPASDGGIYLLGFTCTHRILLEGIKPRQVDVVEHCRGFFEANELLLLPVASDLDSLHDVRRLSRSSETLWIAFHPFLTAILGRRPFAPDLPIPSAVENRALGSRAPPFQHV